MDDRTVMVGDKRGTGFTNDAPSIQLIDIWDDEADAKHEARKSKVVTYCKAR